MPRNVTVTLSNGNPHTYRNVPDNVTPDQIEQRAAKEFPGVRVVSISGGRKAQPAPEPQQPWYQSALSGFERGIKPVADFVSAIDPTKYAANAVTDYFAPGMRQRGENALAAQAQQAQRQNPISYGGGKLAGNIVATLPVGPVLGGATRLAASGLTAGTRGARVAEVFAKGLSSGGLKTGLTPTRAAIKAGTAAAPTRAARGADLAVRASTGATTGMISAGLTEDDLTGSGLAAAAGIGALVPTFGAATGRLALDKVILPAYERVTQQFGKVRAAAILREAFGIPIDAVIALARNAPEGVPFAKVLAQAGKNEPTVQALAANMAEGPGKPIYAPITAAETQAQQDTLNAMARGGTEREARNALATGRKALNETYEDAKKQVFERANLGGKVIPPLSAQAAAAEQTAAGQSGLARRMALGPERAETRLGQMDDLGDQFNPQALNVARGQAGAMGQRAETAAQQAIRLREEAAAARQQIADLNAQGIRALETGPLASQIRGLKQAEGLDDYQRASIEAFAQQIENRGSIIRAGDLDAIRKRANITVANVLGPNVDVGGVNKATAQLVSQVKPFIDDAIENAGGTGYKDLKAGFAQGATELERQQFAGQLAGIFEADPEKFARTVRGAYGTTGAVQEAFPRAGGRNFDIQEMMGPSYMPALENIAQDVELKFGKGGMVEQAAIGDYRAGELLKKPPQEADIFNTYSPVNLLLRAGSASLRKLGILDDLPFKDAATKQALAKGLQSGKSVLDLLETIPLADRMQVKQRLASYGLFSPRNVVNAAGRNTSNAMFNAATTVPSDQNQNAMAGY
jgi:hypothetical protein